MAAWNEKKVEEIADKPKEFDPSLVFKPAIDIKNESSFFMSIYGDSGVGKTHFALTAQLPIYLIDTEVGSDLLIKQLPEEVQKQIFRVNVLEYAGDVSEGFNKDINNNILDAIYKIVAGLVETRCKNSKEKGTIVIDSMSEIYSWLQIWLYNLPDLKRNGKNDEMMSTEWARLDKKWQELFLLLRMSGWNVVLTFKPKIIWKDKQPTDMKEAKWKSGSLHQFDLHAELERLDTHEHRVTVKKSRLGDNTYFNQLTNPTWFTLRDYLSEKSGVKFV